MLSRREALIGAGAVVAAAALPAVAAADAIPPLVTTYSDLDALAAIWGIVRYSESYIELSSGKHIVVPIESDASLQERLVEAIMPRNPWALNLRHAIVPNP